MSGLAAAARPGDTPNADTDAAIAALLARGAQQLAPVRLRHIEALARRAAAHQGLTRRLLDDKLARLVAACSEQVEQGLSAPARAPTAAPVRAPQPGTLAELLAYIGRQSPAPAGPAGSGSGPGGPPVPGLVELKAVRNYRSTWSRLKVDQRMTQLQAKVADNAGPLNTQRLLFEALTVMRDASPLYLQSFMAHVDALLWLDQAGGDGAGKEPARSAR